MDFYEVLDQVLDLLRRRGRVAYRVLKIQFNLTDEHLEALKDEIIYAQKLAIDEDSRVLVWTANTEATGAPAGEPHDASSSPPLARTRPPAMHAMQPAHVNPPPAAPYMPNAERRYLTVMFCDLVDSTTLSRQLDPEDLRAIVHAYQSTCAEVIQRFAGHIAQYLGDGLLVYFGYPQAHEDDAQRAVRAGLGIIEAMGTLNTQLQQEHRIQLAVRVGIHSGLVVVGEMGGGERHERLALGETPNIAARLQSLAAPGRVVISERIQRLVGGGFDSENLDVHDLKGLAEPMRVYQVHGERGSESRFEAATATGLTPLVGREEEIGLLLRRWEQAKEGEGQVVLLTGEAGIGKSRIIQTLRVRLADEPHLLLRGQCLPYYTNSAFYPIIAHLERAMPCAEDAPPTVKLDALEALLAQASVPVGDVAPLFAALLSIPSSDRYPPLTLSPQRQKDKTIEALIDQARGLSQQRPVLFLFEDVHWIDPTSLEVLDRLVDRVQDVRVLLVITYRPEFASPWGGFTHVTSHTLNRLSRRQVATLVAQVTGGKALPQEVLEQIVAKTDGVPLFVEELTKTVLESGLLTDDGERYTLTAPLPPLAIPDTLQGSLMARLDRLAPVRETAQIGAAIGREFSYALLAAVSPLPDAELQEALRQLMETDLVSRRGQPPEATYVFKHALVQDTAYNSLLRSTRRQLHTKIATVMKERFPSLAEAEPELVAHHYTEAGLNEHAIAFWQRAGQRAIQRSASVEAIAHLTKGLKLLETLPETPERTQQELTLQIALGMPLRATKGMAATELERVYARARELCQQIGETSQLFPVLWGLWGFYNVRAHFQTARELAEQLLRLARSVQDPDLLLEAHMSLGVSWFWLGELASTHEYIEQAIALYDRERHRSHAFLYGQDPGVACLSYAAWVLGYLGYADQALQRIHEALTLAQDLAHPFSLAFALNYVAIVHQHRREGQAVQEQAEALITLSSDQGFPYRIAWGTILRGWALAEQGQREEGITQIRQGMAAWRATGAENAQPWSLALLVEAYGKGGRAEEGLVVLAEALTAVDKTSERWYEAELYRLQGELLLMQAAPDEHQAETCFRRALDIARHQQAKSWELRAAMSLSRLWQRQNKREAACQLLGEIYGWFTEGFDTADLQEARALLEAVSWA